MVRRYEEPIEVQAGAGDVAPTGDIDPAGRIVAGDINCTGPTPSAFLWRGRLYVVRDVIGHWRERRAWWRGVLDPDEDDGDTGGVSTANGPYCLEQEVWRVEASSGRLAGTGVYDLGMNDRGKNGPMRGWRLLRVAD
jgi:hypothetical protein